jgi:hypothetical protein
MEDVQCCGIEVEYWDLSKLFFNSTYNQEDSSFLVNIIKFENYADFEICLRRQENIKKTLFISIMTFDWYIDKLYLLLKRYGCVLGVFGRNTFPISIVNENKILRRLFRLNIFKLKKVLNMYKFVKHYNEKRLKEYDVVFLGGNLGWQGIGHINYSDLEGAEIIKVNSNDYDTYLINKKCERVVSEEYILFLDEYLPFHPDTKMFKIKTVPAEEYYYSLNKFFSLLESRFKIPVIIAAHPKAEKYKAKNYFEKRKVYFNKTIALSRYARFVVAHDSTSVNYPISFNVRIHFITSELIRKNIASVHNGTICFSEYLGCNCQWFDRENEKINIIEEVSKEKYERYKYNYQTHKETENVISKDIFIKYLMS